MRGLDSYLQPPDPAVFYCEVGEGSNEDCDHEEECQEREPCDGCGGITSCRCDDAYEEWKERQYDDHLDDYGD